MSIYPHRIYHLLTHEKYVSEALARAYHYTTLKILHSVPPPPPKKKLMLITPGLLKFECVPEVRAACS